LFISKAQKQAHSLSYVTVFATQEMGKKASKIVTLIFAQALRAVYIYRENTQNFRLYFS